MSSHDEKSGSYYIHVYEEMLMTWIKVMECYMKKVGPYTENIQRILEKKNKTP